MMKYLMAIAMISLVSTCSTAPATAGGWATVHRYVHRTGSCPGQEHLASIYWDGKRTANGEHFNPNGHTAAARDWPMGSHLRVTNPHNGRSVHVRVNDRGPWGIAYRQGARLDMARGAANAIGMRGSQYVCIASL